MKTLVIQSHRLPLMYEWLSPCLESVRDWCRNNGYEYQFIGDELFDLVNAELMEKTRYQRVIATDLARLLVLRQALSGGYSAVIWLDADFLVFNPEKFIIPDDSFALGREVWVQKDKSNKFKVYTKVHNAFLAFRRGNSFLDFYIDTAQRLLEQNTGSMPPQFIGPKLLTALHNIASLPVMESAGMLSPLVIKDLLNGKGSALGLFIENSSEAVAGANLCCSSTERKEVSTNEMNRLVDLLICNPPIFNE